MKRALKTEMMLEKSLARPKTRLQRIRAYEREIDKIYKKIHRLQDTCQHERVEKIPKGNTGNWDKSDDHYWYEITCKICDKYWTEPQ